MRSFKLIIFLLLLPVYSAISQEVVDLLNQANEKAQNGNCLEAIQDYDRILSLKPDFSNAFVLKGLCYSMLEKPDSACICFIEGIDRNNEYAKDYYVKYCREYNPIITTEQFKSGKFTYLSWISDTMAYVQRDQEFQTEYSGNSSIVSKFRIKWDSNTNYSLKLVETNDPDLGFLKKSETIKVSILKTTYGGYLYYFDYNGVTGFGKHQKAPN
jgi:tetratricopeptide (TPR) repeat protein